MVKVLLLNALTSIYDILNYTLMAFLLKLVYDVFIYNDDAIIEYI